MLPLALFAFFCLTAARTQAAQIEVSVPRDYQVFQRTSRTEGRVRVDGRIDGAFTDVQIRFIGAGTDYDQPRAWRSIAFNGPTHTFAADVSAPAGGWYRLEVRIFDADKDAGAAAVEHVGVGEVFVVAGQSNSTNYGSEPQKPKSGHVVSFDGSDWRLADDPQPGVQDRSHGGSFIPAFADAMYAKYKVPIGVASTGCGSTSVRQWLPKGHKIDVHPTTDRFIKAVGPNEWECTGQLYEGLLARMRALGPHGFRAVLWHQGESDAGQARAGFADRQISADQYRKLMVELIRQSEKDAGWDCPWVIAQATYHSAADPADPEFRAAQQSLWTQGIAFRGPDTDALTGDYRAGVHFNGKGLKAHGKLWSDCVGAYLDGKLKDDAR